MFHLYFTHVSCARRLERKASHILDTVPSHQILTETLKMYNKQEITVTLRASLLCVKFITVNFDFQEAETTSLDRLVCHQPTLEGFTSVTVTPKSYDIDPWVNIINGRCVIPAFVLFFKLRNSVFFGVLDSTWYLFVPNQRNAHSSNPRWTHAKSRQIKSTNNLALLLYILVKCQKVRWPWLVREMKKFTSEFE